MTMQAKRRARIRAAAAVALALALAGCELPAMFLSWLITPRHQTRTVEAEYDLEADRLIIVPYVGNEVLFEYPTASIEIAGDLINEIRRCLADRVETVVHPAHVSRWQESNLEWLNMSLEDIAGTFKADTLLYVEMERYSLLEESSSNLLRGHLKASVQVVKAGAERNPVYETTVETIFPEDRPIAVQELSQRRLRALVTRLFARDVIRKFHPHKVEVKGEVK